MEFLQNLIWPLHLLWLTNPSEILHKAWQYDCCALHTISKGSVRKKTMCQHLILWGFSSRCGMLQPLVPRLHYNTCNIPCGLSFVEDVYAEQWRFMVTRVLFRRKLTQGAETCDQEQCVQLIYQSIGTSWRNLGNTFINTKWLPFCRRHFETIFFSIKIFVIWFKFHWKLFLKFQLTKKKHHWFK